MNLSKFSILNALVAGPSFGDIAITDRKIRSFGQLPMGWHYGRGIPASSSIIAVARNYHNMFLMLGLFETDAFPGVDGEIMVTAYSGDHYIGVTVEPDKSFTLTWTFEKKDRLYESELSGIKVSNLLSTIASSIQNEKCDISYWSTSNTTMTNTPVNLMIWPSKLQAMVPVHQSYLNRAQLKKVAISANTSIHDISASEEFLPRFGSSMAA